MDGTFAVLFLIAGLTDMGTSHCGTELGCLGKTEAQGALALSAGNVEFRGDKIDHEAYLRYDLPVNYGPFQPAIGVSITEGGDAWIGAGATWNHNFTDNLYVELHLMPGLWKQGDGPDLGHRVEFRSGAEIGYEAANGIKYGLSYDHRSNADISDVNPGIETIQFRVSVPLG